MSEDILDYESLARLKNFYFRAAQRIRGPRSGIHKSYYKGISPDFLEHKEYGKGDDLKQVDWRLFGRHDRLYVKKFEDEVNLRWCLLLDKSASMDYGRGELNKLSYAKKLSATLSYLLLSQGDAVGVAGYSGEGTVIIQPRSGNTNINRIINTLSSFESSGKTEIVEPVIKALESYKSDASFVIVSDLLMDIESIGEALRILRAAKKEVTIFHVLHPDEVDFGFDGQAEFRDMETGEKIIVDTDDVRHTYMERMRDFRESVRQLCHEYESAYVFSLTSSLIEETLIEIAGK